MRLHLFVTIGGTEKHCSPLYCCGTFKSILGEGRDALLTHLCPGWQSQLCWPRRPSCCSCTWPPQRKIKSAARQYGNIGASVNVSFSRSLSQQSPFLKMAKLHHLRLFKVPCSYPSEALVNLVKIWNSQRDCDDDQERCMYQVLMTNIPHISGRS